MKGLIVLVNCMYFYKYKNIIMYKLYNEEHYNVGMNFLYVIYYV